MCSIRIFNLVNEGKRRWQFCRKLPANLLRPRHVHMCAEISASTRFNRLFLVIFAADVHTRIRLQWSIAWYLSIPWKRCKMSKSNLQLLTLVWNSVNVIFSILDRYFQGEISNVNILETARASIGYRFLHLPLNSTISNVAFRDLRSFSR